MSDSFVVADSTVLHNGTFKNHSEDGIAAGSIHGGDRNQSSESPASPANKTENNGTRKTKQRRNRQQTSCVPCHARKQKVSVALPRARRLLAPDNAAAVRCSSSDAVFELCKGIADRFIRSNCSDSQWDSAKCMTSATSRLLAPTRVNTPCFSRRSSINASMWLSVH
jgi:hypothetical protein